MVNGNSNIAIEDITKQLEWVRDDLLKPLLRYAEERGTKQDLIEAINDYAPEPWQDPLVERLETVEGVLEEAAGLRDEEQET